MVINCAGLSQNGFDTTMAFANTATVDYVIDEQAIFTSLDESRHFWSLPPIPRPIQGESRCVNQSDTAWLVYWKYSIGTLAPGDHPTHFGYWNDHLHIDGGDYNRDGKPDRVGVGTYVDFIIRVE